MKKIIFFVENYRLFYRIMLQLSLPTKFLDGFAAEMFHGEQIWQHLLEKIYVPRGTFSIFFVT